MFDRGEQGKVILLWHCNRRCNREFEVGHLRQDFEDSDDTFLYFWRKRCCKIDPKSELSRPKKGF